MLPFIPFIPGVSVIKDIFAPLCTLKLRLLSLKSLLSIKTSPQKDKVGLSHGIKKKSITTEYYKQNSTKAIIKGHVSVEECSCTEVLMLKS